MRHILSRTLLASLLATTAPVSAQMLHDVHEGAGITG